MILLAHMLFGAAIGAVFLNHPYIAIILALLGHYVLDLFPHIEYLDGVEASIQEIKSEGIKKHLVNIAKVGIDIALGLLAIALFSSNQPLIYFCALVACIPDGLTVVSNLFPNRLSSLHDYFHTHKVHYLTKQKQFSKSWKIVTQGVAIVVSLLILQSFF